MTQATIEMDDRVNVIGYELNWTLVQFTCLRVELPCNPSNLIGHGSQACNASKVLASLVRDVLGQ